MRLSVILSALALLLGVVNTGALAGELDNEGSVINTEQRALADQLPATVVVRVSDTDGSVAVLHSNEELPATTADLSNAAFIPMAADQNMTGKAKSELDQDSSTNSWYFYFNSYNWYRPTYYYYGYTYYYRPYYTYSYGGYHYRYYGWGHHYGRYW